MLYLPLFQVVLNLAKSDAGGSAKPMLLPAALISQVEDEVASWTKNGSSKKDQPGASDLGQSGPFYYALGADNRLLRVSVCP